MKRIVITGSIAFDYLMSFPGRFGDHLLPDQLHQVSVSFLVDSLRRERGGVAANIAYTNALLGGRPKIMAAAGQDFGEYGEWLDRHGVDTSGIVVIQDEYCASFFVNTDEDHNQIASFYPGAMALAKNLTFAENAPGMDLAIISPNDPAAMCAYVAECKQNEIPYIYDPSQQIIPLSAAALKEGVTGCLLLTVNEYELNMIEEKTGLTRNEIVDRAGNVLITRGKHGSVIANSRRELLIPAIPPAIIVGPTGAGDAFRGGLLRGYQLELPLELSCRIGALAATYVLENPGTQGHNYTIENFTSRYQTFFEADGAVDALKR
jgi:adenosine kinase